MTTNTRHYFKVTCSFKGKHYRQILADIATTSHAHLIFKALRKLGASECIIQSIDCTEAEFNELFPDEITH